MSQQELVCQTENCIVNVTTFLHKELVPDREPHCECHHVLAERTCVQTENCIVNVTMFTPVIFWQNKCSVAKEDAELIHKNFINEFGILATSRKCQV
jgi:hypothetical protein